MAVNNWTECTVEDIAAPSKHSMATGPFGSAISSKFFMDSGVPIIRGRNLSSDICERIVDDRWVYVSPEKAKEHQRSIVRQNDLVFTCWGTIDQVGFIDGASPYSEYILSNKQMKLTPDPEKADSRFLYYLFSSLETRRRIVSHEIGSTIPGFNLGQLRSFPLRLPPLSEQKAIAAILGTLDAKIKLNRRTNETLESLAHSTFKSWFVDFDPVRAKIDGRQPTGIAGRIADLFPAELNAEQMPTGWAVQPLSSILEINPKRTLRRGDDVPYLDMKNVSTTTSHPDAVVLREFKSGAKFINGDTLLARITPCIENGKTAYVNFLDQDQIGWGSTEFIVLRPKHPFPTEFGYFAARWGEFRTHAIQSMIGTSGRQRVPVDCFHQFYMAIPPAALLDRFGEIAKHALQTSRTYALQSQTLAELRDALLPRLLSGELRVGA